MTRRHCLMLPAGAPALKAQERLRVGVIGLTHGHAQGFLRNYLKRPDLDIAGISEPEASVAARYRERFQLDRSRLYASHAEMLDAVKPEAAMAFNSTYEHREAVELCARRGIPVMMEKPLAVSMEHARAMAAAGRAGRVPVLVNYETTWYPVNAPIRRMVMEEKRLGAIRRIVTHYGHRGPKEIGAPEEFLAWLTDPEKNGAGALFDFGCYGANFATWLLGNQQPLSVTALTHTNKPAVYPRVDDEATVVVQYPGAQLVIQASWNWPFSRKDMEIYGDSGYLITSSPRDYRYRWGAMKQEAAATAPPLAEPEDDVVRYLTAVARGRIRPEGFPSLENNLLVTAILDAARESARTGRALRFSSFATGTPQSGPA